MATVSKPYTSEEVDAMLREDERVTHEQYVRAAALRKLEREMWRVEP